MMDRLNTWLLAIAMTVGLASVTTTLVVTKHTDDQSKRRQCQAVQASNQHTRDFVAALLADPSTDAQTRTQVTRLALKYFPIKSC